MELAAVAAMQHNSAMAGQAVELAQAAAAGDYILSLWREVGPQDTPEAALARLAAQVAAESPHLAGTQHYLGLLGLLQHYSPMHARLALPEPSFLAHATPEAPAAVRAPMPPDTVVLTITCERLEYLTDTRLYAVLRRGPTQVDARMAIVSTAALDELVLRHARIAAARAQELQSGRADAFEAEADFAAYASDVGALLDPLLRPFVPALQSAGVGASGAAAAPAGGPRPHLVLALHPRLYPLPFESIEAFGGCATVSRDISVFSLQQRVLRRAIDRYAPANVQCMVDPFAENDDKSIRFVFGDLHPRAPLFTNTMTTVDSNRQLRPLQPQQVVRMFTQPSANSVLVCCGGRLASTCATEDLCGLQLEHVRALFLFDRGVSSKAMRRENERSMGKRPSLLRQEAAFWVTPMLMLARGVDYVAASTLPTPIPFVDSLAQAAYGALERPSNFTDALSAFVPRYVSRPTALLIPALADGDAAQLPPHAQLGIAGAPIAPALPPIPQQKPSSRPGSTAPKKEASATIGIAVSALESASLKFFGFSPADEHTAIVPPPTKGK